MKQQGHILIVDDDQDILVAGKLLLKRKFSQVDICNRPEQLPSLLADNSFDVILLDMNFGPGESSGQQGFHWLSQIQQLAPEVVVIMITAHGGVDIAVEAIKQGATDFIAKPWHNEKVIATVTTALELKHTRAESQQLKVTNQALVQATTTRSDAIIGDSPAMQNVHSLVSRAAPTDANVLILGENGTGKELIARDIHRQSARAEQVFLSVDLGAISESLFESELFGHKKGAFTGAQQDRIGKIKAAEGGTLFLDEIGNLPLHLQAKLLTVLEQRKVTPLGSNQEEAFNIRIVAATNVSKAKLCDEQYFRQDLLFRLNTVEITLPPLRERRKDIIAIAEHFITLYCKKYQKAKLQLSDEAKAAMLDYQWPGNIRALRHAIERAIILCEGDTLSPQDFQLTHDTPSVASYSQADKAPNTVSLPDELNLDAIEKMAIAQALKKHVYNISHTAKELGLTRAALYRRMEKHGL
ncbi:sigma-54-dependent transcriptional regulator [Thalassotalea euphylliae]|uniref:Sigma-54-dependent Fis family transcriptional regulator n=1 Tax=Thalassotalea euphylliae TaxID=1655234 RepID=A0A3E0U6J5_9GAMM|nr:sigma-54 dependent transcriptional regulator [Thalassotalea euphylliae]REL32207.1 sigma-54-dependent Fis family transcriptional regulator [Thalassotalea euphylliae]